MRLTLFQRPNGELLALLHGVAPDPAALDDGSLLKRVGDCHLPKEGVSREFLNTLGRDGWAVASGEDAGVLRSLAYVRRRRSVSQTGPSLLEAAIEAACATTRPCSPDQGPSR